MVSLGVLSAGLVAAGACASAGGPGGDADIMLEPGATYSFSGAARGFHQYENRRVDFTVPVNGELTIMGETSASLLSSHGACGAGSEPLRMRRRGRSWTFACEGMRFELTTTGGTATGVVSVIVEQEYEHRGGCISWQTDARTGRRGACTPWSQNRSTRRVWSDPVTVAVTVS